MDGGSHGEQHDRESNQRADDCRHQVAVGEATAQQVAGDQPGAEDEQDRRDGGFGKAADAGEDGREIGEGGEDADPAQHGGQQAEQHRAAAQHGKRAFGAVLRSGDRRLVARHQQRDNDEGKDADQRHGQEGRAPAIGLAEPGAERHAENVGDGEAGEHQGDGRGLPVGGDEAGGDDRADAEEGGMRESGQHARRHQRPVVGRQGTGEIAEREDDHEREQQGLARQAAGERAEQRRADHHAKGVAGDEKAGGRDRNAEIGADVEQQAHDDEFSDTDTEGTGGECIESDGHGGRPGEREGRFPAPPDQDDASLKRRPAPILCGA